MPRAPIAGARADRPWAVAPTGNKFSVIYLSRELIVDLTAASSFSTLIAIRALHSSCRYRCIYANGSQVLRDRWKRGARHASGQGDVSIGRPEYAESEAERAWAESHPDPPDHAARAVAAAEAYAAGYGLTQLFVGPHRCLPD